MKLDISFPFVEGYKTSRSKSEILVDVKGIFTSDVPEYSSSDCLKIAKIKNSNIFIKDEHVFVPFDYNHNSKEQFLTDLNSTKELNGMSFVVQSYLNSGGQINKGFLQYVGNDFHNFEKNTKIQKLVSTNEDTIRNYINKSLNIVFIDDEPYKEQSLSLYHKDNKLSPDKEIFLKDVFCQDFNWDNEYNMDLFFPKSSGFNVDRIYNNPSNVLKSFSLGSLMSFLQQENNPDVQIYHQDEYLSLSLKSHYKFYCNMLFIDFSRRSKRLGGKLIENSQSLDKMISLKNMIPNIQENYYHDEIAYFIHVLKDLIEINNNATLFKSNQIDIISEKMDFLSNIQNNTTFKM